MLSFVRPDLRIHSVLELSVARLRELGLGALFLDLDCTLKDYCADCCGPDVVDWCGEMRKAGIQLSLLSNGVPHRVGRLAGELGVPFVAKAYKPFPFRCSARAREFGLPKQAIGVVGDQLFADILAGRLAGLFTILVTPTSAEEPWFTRLKRPLERRVLRMLERRGLPVPVAMQALDSNSLRASEPTEISV